jgi:uncharacterized membrane protein YedE/YeeE
VFRPVTAEEMHAAQVVTGLIFALWLGVGLVPGLKQYASAIRGLALALYLATIAGFVIYLTLWR